MLDAVGLVRKQIVPPGRVASASSPSDPTPMVMCLQGISPPRATLFEAITLARPLSSWTCRQAVEGGSLAHNAWQAQKPGREEIADPGLRWRGYPNIVISSLGRPALDHGCVSRSSISRWRHSSTGCRTCGCRTSLLGPGGYWTAQRGCKKDPATTQRFSKGRSSASGQNFNMPDCGDRRPARFKRLVKRDKNAPETQIDRRRRRF